MRKRERKQQNVDAPVEPEILGPSLESPETDAVIEASPPASVVDRAAPETTAVVPVTALQQYLAEVRRHPYLSKEEELELFEEYRLHGSREAAVKLIMANLRVSVAIASEYLHTGADHMDLIQEGNVGLPTPLGGHGPIFSATCSTLTGW